MSRRTKRTIGLALAVAVVATAVVLFLNLQPRQILPNARTFCVVPEWGKTRLGPTFNNYCWLSNDEALIIPDPGSVSGGIYRPGSPAAARGPFQIPPGADNVTVSPDGKTIAYTDQDLFLVRSDGTAVARVPVPPAADSATPIAWAPDSRSCLVIAAAGFKRVDARTGRADSVFVRAEPPSRAVAAGDEILGFTGPDTVLIALNGSGYSAKVTDGQPTADTPEVLLAEVSLARPPRIVRSFTPRSPRSVLTRYVALSPKGDRLFWGTIQELKVSPIEAGLRRFLRLVPAEPTLVESAWTSNLAGGEIHDLGSYTVPPQVNNDAPWLIDPKWTPDGKQIGFIYKDRIMTIPAE